MSKNNRKTPAAGSGPDSEQTPTDRPTEDLLNAIRETTIVCVRAWRKSLAAAAILDGLCGEYFGRPDLAARLQKTAAGRSVPQDLLGRAAKAVQDYPVLAWVADWICRQGCSDGRTYRVLGTTFASAHAAALAGAINFNFLWWECRAAGPELGWGEYLTARQSSSAVHPGTACLIAAGNQSCRPSDQVVTDLLFYRRAMARRHGDTPADELIARIQIEHATALKALLLTQSTRQPEGQPEGPGTTSGMNKEALALATLVRHPDWSDSKIAATARCQRTSLYRMPNFVKARALLRDTRRDLPRGTKAGKHDKDPGSVEAWDPDTRGE